MTREQLKELGLTDEQVNAVMRQHGIDTQGFNTTITQNNTEITRLKGIEDSYNELLKKQPSEPKPENPELAEALKKIKELEETNIKKDIQAYALSKGLQGEDLDKVLVAMSVDYDVAKNAIDSIANVINARETAAADAKVAELAKGTTNPGGGSADGGVDTKSNAEKVAESVGKSLGGSNGSSDIIKSYF